MANRHVKRGLTSLIVRKMQFKTTVRCQFTSVRMTIVKRQQIISDGKDKEKREPSHTVGAATMEEGMEMLHKN